jgi:hypothetical protein
LWFAAIFSAKNEHVGIFTRVFLSRSIAPTAAEELMKMSIFYNILPFGIFRIRTINWRHWHQFCCIGWFGFGSWRKILISSV